MKCEICDRGPATGDAIYRRNPKGEEGIWRCEFHLERGQEIDPDVRELVEAFSPSKKRGKKC